MGFMDNLAANPGGGSSVYGQPKPPDNEAALSIVNRMKDREMLDFKDKANFMSDLSLKQEKLRSLFAPGQQMNQAVAPDPNQMTGYEKGELGIKKQQLGMEGQKLAQQGKLGQERLDTQAAQEKLNQQKSDQIHQQKVNELDSRNKQHEATIKLGEDRLKQAGTDHAAALAAHKLIADGVEARHANEIALMNLRFEKLKSDHADQMKNEGIKRDQASHSSTTTEVNPDGTKRTVTTDRGSTVQVVGKDGKTYEIPKEQEEDWNANHAHPTMKPGGEPEGEPEAEPDAAP